MLSVPTVPVIPLTFNLWQPNFTPNLRFPLIPSYRDCSEVGRCPIPIVKLYIVWGWEVPMRSRPPCKSLRSAYIRRRCGVIAIVDGWERQVRCWRNDESLVAKGFDAHYSIRIHINENRSLSNQHCPSESVLIEHS